MSTIVDGLDEEDVRFYELVRETVIFVILFFATYALSYLLVERFRWRDAGGSGSGGFPGSSASHDRLPSRQPDAMDEELEHERGWLSLFLSSVVLTIALLWLCILAFTVGLETPGFNVHWLLSWLTPQLVQNGWRVLVPASSVALFLLAPFAFFYYEAEGFGSLRRSRGFLARCLETTIVLAVFSLLVMAASRIAFSLWTGSILDQTPLSNVLQYLPGMMVFLFCAHDGFRLLLSLAFALDVPFNYRQTLQDQIAACDLESTHLEVTLSERNLYDSSSELMDQPVSHTALPAASLLSAMRLRQRTIGGTADSSNAGIVKSVQASAVAQPKLTDVEPMVIRVGAAAVADGTRPVGGHVGPLMQALPPAAIGLVSLQAQSPAPAASVNASVARIVLNHRVLKHLRALWRYPTSAWATLTSRCTRRARTVTSSVRMSPLPSPVIAPVAAGASASNTSAPMNTLAIARSAAQTAVGQSLTHLTGPVHSAGSHLRASASSTAMKASDRDTMQRQLLHDRLRLLQRQRADLVFWLHPPRYLCCLRWPVLRKVLSVVLVCVIVLLTWQVVLRAALRELSLLSYLGSLLVQTAITPFTGAAGSFTSSTLQPPLTTSSLTSSYSSPFASPSALTSRSTTASSPSLKRSVGILRSMSIPAVISSPRLTAVSGAPAPDAPGNTVPNELGVVNQARSGLCEDGSSNDTANCCASPLGTSGSNITASAWDLASGAAFVINLVSNAAGHARVAVVQGTSLLSTLMQLIIGYDSAAVTARNLGSFWGPLIGFVAEHSLVCYFFVASVLALYYGAGVVAAPDDPSTTDVAVAVGASASSPPSLPLALIATIKGPTVYEPSGLHRHLRRLWPPVEYLLVGRTSAQNVLLNAATWLLLSSSLPLTVWILGIVRFDISSYYPQAELLDNSLVAHAYNLTFLALACYHVLRFWYAWLRATHSRFVLWLDRSDSVVARLVVLLGQCGLILVAACVRFGFIFWSSSRSTVRRLRHWLRTGNCRYYPPLPSS